MRPRPRPLAALAALCVLALGGCANAVQDQPVAHNILENVLLMPYPVYWLGASFEGHGITEVAHDPSGATSIQYGDCLEGGQGTCVAPLLVVTSPDNSFLPAGASAPRRAVSVRGVAAVSAQRGRTIEIPTGGVVVDIYAATARTAASAAQSVVAINVVGEPRARLPARLADSGFGTTPLPAQTPSPVRALR